MAGESIELIYAKKYIEKHGGDIVRRRDGFVIVYKRVDGKRVLIWFRKSPINNNTIKMLKKILKRMGHDEIWLVKLYKEPDFTEEYKKIIKMETYYKELDL